MHDEGQRHDMGLTVLETNMLQLPQAIYGTWQSDADRTFTEIKRHLRPDHPKLKEFESSARFIPLTISFAPDSVLYTYRDEQVRAKWRILGCDEFSLVSEVEPTWINEQVLWHTPILSLVNNNAISGEIVLAATSPLW
jgi:hypothetical protein